LLQDHSIVREGIGHCIVDWLRRERVTPASCKTD
jgi:hypothetical protein